MMGGYFVLMLLVLIVDGVFGDEVTVMEGDSVTLNTDVTKQQNETMLWYFNNISIAQINDDPSKSCLYYGKGGIFRDRLDVNYETGSLNITNITSEHAGRYELEFIRSNSTATTSSFNNNKNRTCDRAKIISKLSNQIFKIFNVTITLPGSAQSLVGKAGIFLGVVAVVLLV